MRDQPGAHRDLIDRLNAGDPAAGDELFTRLYRRLVQLAGLMLGTFPDLRRQHDAESIVHHAWIDLQAALRSVKPADPRSYVGLAARKGRQVLLDLAQRERRRLDSVSLDQGASGLDGPAPLLEPSDRSMFDPGRLEVWTRFHEAVSELPDDLREVFEVYFYSDDEPNQAEIARLLGIEPRQVSRLIAKARSRLAGRVDGLRDLLS